jgi:outer membrane protein
MGVMLRVLIVMAVLVIPVAASAQGKIGIINLDEALMNSSAGKAASASFKSKFEAREKAISSQADELRKMQEELQKKSVALSQDALKSKQIEFETKARKFNDDGNKLKQEEEQFNQASMKPLLMRLQKVVTDYAAKNGYTALLEARSLPYFDPKLDVTAAVQAEFDKTK